MKFHHVVGASTIICAALSACADSFISPAQPEPQTVQVAYCNGAEPQWVAFQDGDGPWTRVAATTAGGTTTFQYTFQANRGGIARTILSGGGLTSLIVLYGAPAELAATGATKLLYCGTPVSKTLLGTVAGLDTNESALIGGGLTHTVANPAAGGHFILTPLSTGPHDLVVARATRTNGQTAVTGLIVRRDIDLPDSTTLPAFDFGSSEAFASATATLTIGNIGADNAAVGMRLITATSEVLFSLPLNASADVTRPYAALPVAQLRPSDLQEVLVSAIAGSANRSAQLYFRSMTDRVVPLPAALLRPTFSTVATTPALRLRARFVPQDDYDRVTSIVYQQGTTTIVGVQMTPAYAALNGTGYDLVVPDLSAAAGFNPAWALHSGSTVLWTAGRIGGTLGLGIDAVPSDGTTQRSAFDTDVIPGS